MVTIYHNSRCSKSRNALKLLQEKKEEIQVVEYLKELPTENQLTKLINLLGITPIELVRTNEKIFKEKYKGQQYSDQEWIKIMVENPVLIERPIVIKGDKAVIGRPIENIFKIL